ncbi:MAG: cysteine desulfurase family protein [Phycisphaerales bacterium]|nr:cysteine desulfurase family protein [Phycisphaerales bacterium]
MDMIYLDHNATTPAAPSVLEAMHQVLTNAWANPSSIHRLGQQARRRVDEAREQVASFIGAQAREIVFSGGGTESVNTAIRSALRSRPDRRLVITSQVEHSAVHELLEDLQSDGIETLMLAHDSSGVVDCDSLEEILRSRGDEVALVTVMWANNETGVIEPVDRIASLCQEHGVLFHSDATQWVGKMPADVSTIPFDMISFASHKFHGPKGVGVLFARTGVSCHPLVIGGGQERSRRGGTENVPGIVGLGEACRLSSCWFEEGGPDRMAPLRDAFEQSIVSRIPDACVNGRDVPRMWSTTSIGFPELEPELVLLMLSERGVCASSGSACSSGALKPSKVIEAIGRQPCQVADVPYGAVRFSMSRETTQSELQRGAEIVIDVVQELQQDAPTMTAVPPAAESGSASM